MEMSSLALTIIGSELVRTFYLLLLGFSSAISTMIVIHKFGYCKAKISSSKCAKVKTGEDWDKKVWKRP